MSEAGTFGPRLAGLALNLHGLPAWQRYATAFLSGALTALAFAPFNFVPILLISFTLLVWLIDASANAPRPVRAAALIGWWFGFGGWMAGIYWIGFAFMVDSEAHAWMIPFVAFAMPGGLAIFSCLAALASRLAFDRIPGPERVFAFAALFVAMEWLRGNILTGFPWNLPGYAWAGITPVVQSVSLMGVYGLSLLTVLLAAGPAAMTTASGEASGAKRGSAPFLGSLSLIIALGIWGSVRVPDSPVPLMDGVVLRLVQPAVPQKEKWQPENRRRVLQDYLQMSNQEGADDVTHLIWPESAVPFLLGYQPGVLGAIGHMLKGERLLLTGAARMQPARDAQQNDFFNAVHLISADGKISQSYDKYHLVPFGEYMPMKDLLSRTGLTPLVQMVGGFSSGPGPKVMSVPGAGTVMPMVCYEVIFPGEAGLATNDEGQVTRPDWILNVTNDAWFANTSGPRQHLVQARFRAAEEGLPVVRAANTGISAVIDPWGQVMHRLELNEKGVLDAGLPEPLPATVFARHRHLIFWMMMALTALVPAIALHQSGKSRRS